jgi:type II secretory pathway pseudopilin PulG
MRAELPRKSRAAGFTLFELIVVIMLFAASAGLFVDRYVKYQEMAEKAAMEQTAGSIRSALTIQVAALIARGRTNDIARLAELNPMTFLVDTQKNYVGELFQIGVEDAPPGSWYFDLRTREVVYVVERDTHFQPGPSGSKSVRYKVTAVYNEGIPSGPNGSGKKSVGGLAFKEVERYTWVVK